MPRGTDFSPGFSGAIFLGATPTMLKIECPCGHVGVVSAERLPRSLTCSRCGSCRYVKGEDGTRIVNRVAFEEWLLGAPGAPRVTERKL